MNSIDKKELKEDLRRARLDMKYHETQMIYQKYQIELLEKELENE